MKIETMWLTKDEASIAIQSLLKDDMNNNVVSFGQISPTMNGNDIMDLINSVDDGYFPYDLDNNNDAQATKVIIEEFIDDDYDFYYAFFIMERFCGLIKISECY